ncbi:BMC domain-containing protein [Desulfobaculum bizertense]|uniref:Carboxysome shell and ethanolamine utilization microcompartment protein CcmL/EutN n=1 Tax=Desulfobaculum bizertense DSM 18034 TaxID=1121442 RepID=A0A1T4W4K2_9BACT|nr:BMC domain-containing protein [Desulfobaculum bizertense]UIJ38671.1 BMC domain-containing protein [Desulfobaculum bizertense]SKA72172.1 Carboxysome shell and ethanolamine utilization microcompartment protein CcmL/EutN [Desulfobaculum bizertense DSM 18034]
MDTLGVVESRGIAAGAELADMMVKVADVELVRAGTICSGRYLIYVSGDREAVEASVTAARESGRPLKDSFVISNISPQVTAVLKKSQRARLGDALGVIECRSVSSGVNAADCAVKQASIELLRLVTGQGINGKSYFVIGGDVAAVREAAESAKTALGKNLLDAVVIPRPDISVVRALTSGVR